MSTLLDDTISYAETPAAARLFAPIDAPLDRDQLAGLAATLFRDRRLWRDLVHHEPERRWWTRLIRHDHVDAWLITWPGEETTDLHDHGGSAAAITVVEGELEHVLASRKGGFSREILRPGTLLSVAPDAIHDVRNTERTPAVSIHVYSPPLASMTYFRPERDSLKPVRTVYSDQPELEHPW